MQDHCKQPDTTLRLAGAGGEPACRRAGLLYVLADPREPDMRNAGAGVATLPHSSPFKRLLPKLLGCLSHALRGGVALKFSATAKGSPNKARARPQRISQGREGLAHTAHGSSAPPWLAREKSSQMKSKPPGTCVCVLHSLKTQKGKFDSRLP